MAENDAPDGFVTLYSPVNGEPWHCPEAAVDYWVDEKGWKKQAPNKQAREAAKELNV